MRRRYLVRMVSIPALRVAWISFLPMPFVHVYAMYLQRDEYLPSHKRKQGELHTRSRCKTSFKQPLSSRRAAPCCVDSRGPSLQFPAGCFPPTSGMPSGHRRALSLGVEIGQRRQEQRWSGGRQGWEKRERRAEVFLELARGADDSEWDDILRRLE